jgi:hypothetical protein
MDEISVCQAQSYYAGQAAEAAASIGQLIWAYAVHQIAPLPGGMRRAHIESAGAAESGSN